MDKSFYDPQAPSLKGEEAEAAISNQLVTYRKVVRGPSDDPIPQQAYGNFSVNILDQPRRVGKGSIVYGFIKLRGNWTDPEMCKKKAADIIVNQDSKYKIRVGEVGKWLPLMGDDSFVAESVDVKTNLSEEEVLREEAMAKEREKQQKMMKEIKEREEEVKNSKDLNDDPESLDYYIMKRVVWINLNLNIDVLTEQLKDLEKKFVENRKLLAALEEKHPDYPHQWLDKYNEARVKAGIAPYKPSSTEEQRYG